MNGGSSAPAVVTRFQNQGDALNGEGRSNNENAHGVPVTTILINNALNSFFDPPLIDRSAAATGGINSSFQFIGLDCESNADGSDRSTRPVFGFNYFRTCNQASSVSGNPVTTSNQRRCIVINGSTGEVLANLQPGVINSTTENNTIINAINSVTPEDLITGDVPLEPADIVQSGGNTQSVGSLYRLSISENLSGNSLNAFNVWAIEQNIPAPLRGINADPDGDSIDNFSEYAYGTNPIVADPVNTAPTIVRSSDGENFQLVFQRSKTAVVAPFTLLSSATLSSFSQFSPPEDDIEIEDLENIVRVRVTLP